MHQCHVEGKIAADNLDRVHEGQGVRITSRPAAGLDHQLANGEVGQEKAVDLLPDQVRCAVLNGKFGSDFGQLFAQANPRSETAMAA